MACCSESSCQDHSVCQLTICQNSKPSTKATCAVESDGHLREANQHCPAWPSSSNHMSNALAGAAHTNTRLATLLAAADLPTIQQSLLSTGDAHVPFLLQGLVTAPQLVQVSDVSYQQSVSARCQPLLSCGVMGFCIVQHLRGLTTRCISKYRASCNAQIYT